MWCEELTTIWYSMCINPNFICSSISKVKSCKNSTPRMGLAPQQPCCVGVAFNVIKIVKGGVKCVHLPLVHIYTLMYEGKSNLRRAAQVNCWHEIPPFSFTEVCSCSCQAKFSWGKKYLHPFFCTHCTCSWSFYLSPVDRNGHPFRQARTHPNLPVTVAFLSANLPF